jgi:hypothetical protein
MRCWGLLVLLSASRGTPFNQGVLGSIPRRLTTTASSSTAASRRGAPPGRRCASTSGRAEDPREQGRSPRHAITPLERSRARPFRDGPFFDLRSVGCCGYGTLTEVLSPLLLMVKVPEALAV